MNFAAKTDIGAARSVNEDNYCVVCNEHGDWLAVVCDGIGGSNAGEVASATAISILKDAFLEAPVFHRDYQVNEFIQKELNHANDTIYSRALNNPECRGMGTTAVGILIAGCGTYIFNVGDSRLYAMYDDGLTQMSEDHSVIARLLREKKITQEEARHHESRNKLTNALGVWKVFRIDVNKIQPDFSQVLLCSDGLSGYASRQEIEQVMYDTCSVQEKCSRLIHLAASYGGMDNCTVIILDPKEEAAA